MFEALFKRKAGAAMAWRSEGEDVLLTCRDKGQSIPVDEWSIALPALSKPFDELVERLEEAGWVSDRPNADHIRLTAAQVAGMDSFLASVLGLPAVTAFALDLHPIDRIDQESFRLRVRWVRPGGQPVRTTRRGAILESEVGPRRIPQPLYGLVAAAGPLSQALERSERLAALARLRLVWPETPGIAVEADSYLKDLRVHHASGVSLKLKTLTPDHTEFEPVLFNTRDLATAAEHGAMQIDEDIDNILAPAAQRLFAEDRFRREGEARPVYILRDGEYVFIDPLLRPVLDQIRQVQDAPEAERREFILNPRRCLRDRLGDEMADTIGLDARFVDTEQFSARVAGVDVWRTPVLPWLTAVHDNNWLPERFGLRVGEEYFAVPAANVREVIDRVEASAHAGESTADVTGLLEAAVPYGAPPPDVLPVNDQCRAALVSLAPFAATHGPDARALVVNGGWDPTRGKLFLVVRNNFEEVDYAPFDDAAEAELPTPEVADAPLVLRSSLKQHQIEGLSWLVHSARCGRPGALLADDMGLGKTLQAIAFMAWLQERSGAGGQERKPFLIVAPTGLLGTWRDEITKHLAPPRLGTLVPAFGANLKLLREEDGFGTRDIETGKASLNAADWRDAGVVLTTYETLRDYHFSFAKTRFGLIIYDEVQKLKNPASQVSRAARALNADFVLGMTGTPVENRLQDLWAIMDVIMPGLLGASRDFERHHDPSNKAALTKLKVRLTEPAGNHPQPMLRRMKGEVLSDMPGKHIHTLKQDMPGVQADAYRDVVLRAAAAGSAGNLGQGGMLTVLARMRGVSLHPIDPREAPDDLDAYAQGSARLAQALTVLEGVQAAGEKALIFVEDLAMQERLAGLIQSRFQLARRPMRINGTVPGPKRQDMVNAFQCDDGRFDVMILSPKAGGVGLTLTAANHVIHLSRWWNPAVEDQATDRVFRIGQTRDVHIHLPLAIHPDPDLRGSSFDLRLDALISRKRNLTRDLFLPPDANDAELAELFREVSLDAEIAPTPQAESATVTPDAPPSSLLFDRTDGAPSDGGIRLWRRGPGEARPTQEILELFAGKHITQLVIRDPYALVDDGSRRAQVRLIEDLAHVAGMLEGVVIEYAPEIDRQSIDNADRRAFGSHYVGRFAQGAPKLFLTRRPRRGEGDDFHDRFIEIDVKGADGGIGRHELTIGRGVQALYDMERQCTVTYAPPSAAR